MKGTFFQSLFNRRFKIVLGLTLTLILVFSGVFDFGKIFLSKASTEETKSSPIQSPIISATLNDTFPAPDMDNKPAPGAVVTCTAQINNTGTDATGVQFTDTLDAVATLVPGSLHASPIANNETYNAVGNTFLEVGVAASGFPAVSQAGSVLDNDTAVTAHIVIRRF